MSQELYEATILMGVSAVGILFVVSCVKEYFSIKRERYEHERRAQELYSRYSR